MPKALFLLLCSFLFLQQSQAAFVQDTLYIHHDTLRANWHYMAFNSTASPDTKNAVLKFSPGDQLQLTIINTDTLLHDFTIDGVIETGNQIPPGGQGVWTFTINNPGTYRYYSSFLYGYGLGASGIVLVGYENYSCFYWNLFEQQLSFSTGVLDASVTGITSSYKPQYFWINGVSYPETLMEPDGMVMGMVGDSIIIAVTNSGKQPQPLHLHGFHVKILQVTGNTQMLGWIKDSFPIAPGQSMTLLLVPDKPGMYMVHNHNLRAATNAGLYPGGMMTHIQIDP
jgi:FtsP/CotA-like multicopper oxidase with cupredoxin domain